LETSIRILISSIRKLKQRDRNLIVANNYLSLVFIDLLLILLLFLLDYWFVYLKRMKKILTLH